MNFKIQAGIPRFEEYYDDDIDNIGDAIEASYSLNTEYMVMVFNYIPVLLSYKYDISIIIDDILKILSSIRTKEIGYLRVNWPSNTFCAIWDLEWNDSTISINTEWTTVIGETEKLLNDHCKLTVDKLEFAYEWKKVLHNIINALEGCGYNDDIKGVTVLKKEFNMIEKFGVLYE